LGRSATLSGRTVGWPIIIGVLNNRVVGAGYESFWLGPRLQKLWAAFPGLPINEAHNGYIEMFLILGWIGVIFLGVLIATGYRNVIGNYRRDPDIGSLRTAYFLAIIVTGLTEAVFKMMAPLWIVFLLITAKATWVPLRKGTTTGASSQNLQEPSQDPDAVLEARPVAYWTHFDGDAAPEWFDR